MRGVLLILALLVAAGCDARVGEPAVRTELYCGFSTPKASVTEREFRDFLERSVTPRFPEGYTVEQAEGVWKGSGEPSRVLIIVHPDTRDSSDKIDLIRKDYKFRFDQESVLRVDAAARASF